MRTTSSMPRGLLLAVLGLAAPPALADSSQGTATWSGPYLSVYGVGIASDVRGVSTRGDGTFGANANVESAALALYQQSDAGGLADGSRAVAYMYEFGEGIGVDRKKALHYYDRAASRGSSLARRAAANLRSPDYDQPARYYGGDSAHSSPVQDNRCADNGGHMDGTQCFSAGRVPIDPSNGQHYR